MLLLGLLSSVSLAQTKAPAKVRRLSLQDCIKLTLEYNLDLKIDRYNPQISLFTYRATYGDYDPSFTLSGEHIHSESGSRILSGGFSIPGSVSDSDSFSSGLTGLLPWGTRYGLGTGTPIQNTYGTSGASVNDLSNPLFFTTNNIVLLTNGTTQPVSFLRTNFAQTAGRAPFENSVGSVELRVSQPLLKNFLIDQTRLSIRVARIGLKESELVLKTQVMDVITTLEKAYYDLIYDRENVAVQQKALEAAEQLVAENRKKVEVGALAPLDLKSAEAQRESSLGDLITAQSTLAVQENLFKQFMTSRYTDWADISIEPAEALSANRQALNVQDSWSKGLAQRPELLQARLDVEKAGIQVKYSRNQLLPELDVFATYGYNGSGREFSDALNDIERTDRPYYTYGGSITLPLARIKERNNHSADKARREQFVWSLKKLEQSIIVTIASDIRQVQSSYEQVNARRKAREFAEDDLAAEKKKLESGKSTPYTVLQKLRDLTTARGGEIQALANYNKNISQLSRDEGTTLERLNVNFETK